MGREKFNLLHPLFWEALEDAVTSLDRGGLDYAVVGGAAAQIWIAHLLTGGGERPLESEPELPLRLRSTRDIDVSTLSTPDRVLAILNELAATSHPPVEILSARAARVRGVHLNLTLEPGDVTGFSAHYERILDQAEKLTVRRGTRSLAVRVESLADLVGTKLTRKGSQQAKDLLDLDALCLSLSERGRTVSVARVNAYLDDAARLLLDRYRRRFPEVFPG
ncbi:MAG: hypothetical protein AB1758_35200 [Candidatus Eremiobacterota bacterium]